MTDEEIAAVAALLLLMTDGHRPKRQPDPISSWAKAARDYDNDDSCSRKF
jgi:hypothetical protein